MIWSGDINNALVRAVLSQIKDGGILRLNSEGGNLEDAYAILDHLDRFIDVTTVATGCCMSAAPVLIAAGTKGKRYATSRTRFMLHAARKSVREATASELRTAATELEMAERRYSEALAEYTPKTVRWWTRRFESLSEDWYFGPEEAIELGIIDRVV